MQPYKYLVVSTAEGSQACSSSKCGPIAPPLISDATNGVCVCVCVCVWDCGIPSCYLCVCTCVCVCVYLSLSALCMYVCIYVCSGTYVCTYVVYVGMPRGMSIVNADASGNGNATLLWVPERGQELDEG